MLRPIVPTCSVFLFLILPGNRMPKRKETTYKAFLGTPPPLCRLELCALWYSRSRTLPVQIHFCRSSTFRHTRNVSRKERRLSKGGYRTDSPRLLPDFYRSLLFVLYVVWHVMDSWMGEMTQLWIYRDVERAEMSKTQSH